MSDEQELCTVCGGARADHSPNSHNFVPIAPPPEPDPIAQIVGGPGAVAANPSTDMLDALVKYNNRQPGEVVDLPAGGDLERQFLATLGRLQRVAGVLEDHAAELSNASDSAVTATLEPNNMVRVYATPGCLCGTCAHIRAIHNAVALSPVPVVREVPPPPLTPAPEGSTPEPGPDAAQADGHGPETTPAGG